MSFEHDGSEYVSREEAARCLCVNVRTVDRYGEQGKLQRFVRLDRIVYKREEVEALAAPVPYESVMPISLKRRRAKSTNREKKKSRSNCRVTAALLFVFFAPLGHGIHLMRALYFVLYHTDCPHYIHHIQSVVSAMG